jgi:hypothetical protein
MPNNSGQEFFNFPSGPTYYEFWEDWNVELSVGTADKWTLSQLGAAGTAVLTTDAAGGVCVFATTAADTKGPEIQGNMETFSLVQGKTTDFICKLQHSIVLTDTWSLGLGITDTSVSHATSGALASVNTQTDFVGFIKPEADSGVYGVVIRDSTQVIVTGSLATLVNATDVVLGYRVSMDADTAGKGVVQFYVNGLAIGSPVSSLTMPYSAEEILTPTFALAARSSTGSTAQMDYIGVRQQR